MSCDVGTSYRTGGDAPFTPFAGDYQLLLAPVV
jgi:hypothetical protein